MKDQNKAVWIGVEHLQNDPAFQQVSNSEFVELPLIEQLSEESALSTESSRRDFLKYLGFGIGAATIAASCEIPVKKAIPYVIKPDTIVPGIATYYASTFVQGGDPRAHRRPDRLDEKPADDQFHRRHSHHLSLEAKKR